jgi:hypothetical protein
MLLPSKWTFGANAGWQKNDFGAFNSSFYNVGTNGSKKLVSDKLDLGLQFNYAINNQGNEQMILAKGNLYTILISAIYKTTEQSAISFNSGYIHNAVENSSIGTNQFSEFRNTLNFQYRFNPRKR